MDRNSPTTDIIDPNYDAEFLQPRPTLTRPMMTTPI